MLMVHGPRNHIMPKSKAELFSRSHFSCRLHLTKTNRWVPWLLLSHTQHLVTLPVISTTKKDFKSIPCSASPHHLLTLISASSFPTTWVDSAHMEICQYCFDFKPFHTYCLFPWHGHTISTRFPQIDILFLTLENKQLIVRCTRYSCNGPQNLLKSKTKELLRTCWNEHSKWEVSVNFCRNSGAK